MRRRRPHAVLALTAAALATTVVPAFAHASFDVVSVPVDSDVDLVVFAPLEREDTNKKVEVLFPAGFDVAGCSGPAAWLCDVEEGSKGTVVTFETLAGRDSDIAFEVSVRTPSTPGDRSIPVVQTYSDGTEAAWIGPPGSDEPAPVLAVTGGDEAPTQNTAPPASHDDTPAEEQSAPADPESDVESSPAPTSDPSVDAAPTAAPAADEAGDEDPGPVAAASPTPTEPTDEGSPTPEPTTSPAATDLAVTPAAEDDDGGSGGLALIALGLLLVAGGGAAWWWQTQQR